MANKGHSDKNFWGEFNHYDERGKKTGYSTPNIWGGFNEYDEHGKKIGETNPNFWGGYNHYDTSGRKTGESDPNAFGGFREYDKNGKRIGSSDPTLFGYRHNDNEGCYIATCVYGSYDCPEVWTLRRFRDNCLRRRALGNLFVKVYYRLSPGLVRHFGKTKWFRKFWKRFLDRFTAALLKNGYEDTPYADGR